jgi:hypothetical protein
MSEVVHGRPNPSNPPPLELIYSNLDNVRYFAHCQIFYTYSGMSGGARIPIIRTRID